MRRFYVEAAANALDPPPPTGDLIEDAVLPTSPDALPPESPRISHEFAGTKSSAGKEYSDENFLHSNGRQSILRRASVVDAEV